MHHDESEASERERNITIWTRSDANHSARTELVERLEDMFATVRVRLPRSWAKRLKVDAAAPTHETSEPSPEPGTDDLRVYELISKDSRVRLSVALFSNDGILDIIDETCGTDALQFTENSGNVAGTSMYQKVLQLDPSIIPDNVHGFVVFLQSGDAPLESCELACSRLSPLPSSLSAGSGLLPSPRGATGGLLPSPRGGCSGGGSGSSGTCTTATGGVLLSPRGGGSGRPLSSGPIPTATATMTATGTQSYLETTHDTTRRTTREMQRNQTCLISIEKQRQHNYYLWFMFTKTSEGEWKQQLLRHAFTASNAIKAKEIISFYSHVPLSPTIHPPILIVVEATFEFEVVILPFDRLQFLGTPKVNRSAAVSSNVYRMMTQLQPSSSSSYQTLAFVMRPVEHPSVPGSFDPTAPVVGSVRLECATENWSNEVPLLASPVQLLLSMSSRANIHAPFSRKRPDGAWHARLSPMEVPGSARTSTLRDISHITKLFSWQTPTGVRVTVLKAVNINKGRDYGVVIKFNGVEYATIPTRMLRTGHDGIWERENSFDFTLDALWSKHSLISLELWDRSKSKLVGTFSYDLAKFRLPFCGSLLLPDSGQVQLVACIDLLQHNMPIAV